MLIELITYKTIEHGPRTICVHTTTLQHKHKTNTEFWQYYVNTMFENKKYNTKGLTCMLN